MENHNIVVLKHHPMNLLFTNSYYQDQFGKDQNPEDFLYFDVTSRNKDKEFIRYLSPFFLGPVKASDGVEFRCFENLWQFGKVYEGKAIYREMIGTKKHVDHEVVLSDEEGNPTEEWFRIREEAAKSPYANRHPFLGKPLYQRVIDKDGNVRRLGYIESRKEVYIPGYAKLVYGTPSYQKLKDLVDAGKKIALIDFDGYNYDNPIAMEKLYAYCQKKHPEMKTTLEDFLSIHTIQDVFLFPDALAGHAFVLKAMLQGDVTV